MFKNLNKGMSTTLVIFVVLVLVVILVGGFFAYQYWWEPEEIPEKTSQPEEGDEEGVLQKEDIYSIIDKKDFFGITSLQTYKIGTAEFKIYPKLELPDFGYFEVYNKGEEVYSSEPVYAISDLLSFEYKGNKYIIVGEYSGGAHCCFREYAFCLDKDNSLKLIKTLDLGNTYVTEDNLITKNGKLYLKIGDDRFAYFYVPFVESYFFDQYFLIEEDKLIKSNAEFKEEYLEKAMGCENDLDKKLEGKEISSFEDWFSSLVCRVVNYMLAGENERAWENFEKYFNDFSLISPNLVEVYGSKEPDLKKFKGEIIDKMTEARY